ncbi:MAG TPA: tRNA uridine-5-carboxymethylaminomethyl(34) synthesis GTPase MnmE [Desulfobulbaceae bacterium]|nr:tRNA uridine-5-carboxymethylaminomethyl(34) synthesis GTPase MnmE [Desulfobulbaceae bacterium]
MPAQSLAPDATIAAIATPVGAGGIAIIRMSGDRALPILRAVFRPRATTCSFRSHQMYYGQVVHPGSGTVIDEAMAVFMAAPNSYTREDVVEIHGHGNFLLAQSLLEALLVQGAILAEPGEFTKRAFLNGRIDLTRAEAVLDLLTAKTRKGLNLAERQLAGALFQRIEAIRGQLIDMTAFLEVAIDFPDDEVDIVDWLLLARQLRDEIEAPLAGLLAAARQGELLRDGATVVICGLPNGGKSSLLNVLLRRDRALVTAIPGTTRDTIEEYFDLNGLPVRCIDTAGIRQEADTIEEQGIARARAAIARADLLLFVHDATQPWSEAEEELLAEINDKPLLCLVNKIDAAPGAKQPMPPLPGQPLFISATTGAGLDALRQAMFAQLADGASQWEEDACAPNLRQAETLRQALTAIRYAQETLTLRAPDLLAVDLRQCLDALNGIIGLTTTEDILDAVFSRFCLGK